ncbi:MAG: DEAD/DEAH box helicase family protein, partial [Chlamydiales bacterium]|nr:DEAD/DEAH box helicase family protein [Chlamydiales bacterium]
LLPKEFFHLASFLSQYYATPLAKVLKVMLPSSLRKNIKAKEQLFIKPLLSRPQMQTRCETLRLTSQSQAKVLEVLLKYPKGALLSILLEETKGSESPIKTLTRKGVLEIQKMIIERSPIEDFEFFQTNPKKLSHEQKEALDKIRQTIDHKHFEVHLLHGITGSGKTEVYLQAITYAREKNLGALLLVPEIALTSQTLERLQSRFTEKLWILHHRLSDGERFDMWHAIREGRISIVVGARSAVFSPIQNLGLIIVDEEHEPSYKQTEEQPCYHARDVAILRAKML